MPWHDPQFLAAFAAAFGGGTGWFFKWLVDRRRSAANELANQRKDLSLSEQQFRENLLDQYRQLQQEHKEAMNKLNDAYYQIARLESRLEYLEEQQAHFAKRETDHGTRR